jgi:hypothetical protein
MLPLNSLASGSKPVSFTFKNKIAKGRRMMSGPNFGTLPRKNPCAQCGHPIPAPDWIEAAPRRIAYLWHCRVCDYRFEAVAYFDEQQLERQALAA